jgi:hypothetical protein
LSTSCFLHAPTIETSTPPTPALDLDAVAATTAAPTAYTGISALLLLYGVRRPRLPSSLSWLSVELDNDVATARAVIRNHFCTALRFSPPFPHLGHPHCHDRHSRACQFLFGAILAFLHGLPRQCADCASNCSWTLVPIYRCVSCIYSTCSLPFSLYPTARQRRCP